MLLLALAALTVQEDPQLAEVRVALAAWHDDAWTRVFAPDAELELRLIGAVNDADGRSGLVAATLSHGGRDAVKAALAELYRDMEPKVEFDVAARRGLDGLLHGQVDVLIDGLRRSFPLFARVRFDENGKIRRLTLTTAHVRPGPAPAK